MLTLLAILIILLVLAYLWFAKAYWCLWSFWQWRLRRRYQVQINGADTVPKRPFVAVCRDTSILMALLLRRATTLPIICVTEQTVPGVAMGKLLARNRICLVPSLDALPDVAKSAVIVPLSVYQKQADDLPKPVCLLQLCGAEVGNQPTFSAKRRWLHMGIRPADTRKTEPLGQQWHYFDVQCWQQYVAALPNLLEMWLRQAKAGGKRVAVVDSTGASVTHTQLLVAVASMRGKLRKALAKQPRAGLCLPASVGGSVAILTCLSLGKTLVNLNYTASAAAIQTAISAAGLQTIITSKRFLQQLSKKGFDISPLFKDLHVVYLEDVKQALGKFTLLKNLLFTQLMPFGLLKHTLLTSVKPDDVATIIFSSGSEGQPKGVELTWQNILGNIKQAGCALEATSNDVMLGILPTFHALGFTITTLLPLVEGLKLVCHPDPRDAAAIGKLVQQHQGTILCGTSTFFRLYVRNRNVTPDMFTSLRYVIAGAEKLQPEVRMAFEAKFQKVIYEGYGTTELSPVASTNQPDTTYDIRHEIGSIGRALPGCMFRIIDPQTHKELSVGEAGMITVGGVNVMKGYLNNPDKTRQVILEHRDIRWYLTGDKGRLDERGFVTILDRYSRFAKLGGEMVSLGAVEQQIKAVLDNPEIEILAVGIPDAKKGENIVLLIAGEIDAADVQSTVMKADINNLLKPQRYLKVEAIPKLGSGKTDFAAAKKLAKALKP